MFRLPHIRITILYRPPHALHLWQHPHPVHTNSFASKPLSNTVLIHFPTRLYIATLPSLIIRTVSPQLTSHWTLAHTTLCEDLPHLAHYRVIFAEDLLTDPNGVLELVLRDLGLQPSAAPMEGESKEDPAADAATAAANREHRRMLALWRRWEKEQSTYSEETATALAAENWMFGYQTDALARDPSKPQGTDLPMLCAGGAPHGANGTSNGTANGGVPEIEMGDGDRSASPQRLLIISFGTRGDVQPCIALANGFQKKGYSTWIFTNDEQREIVTQSGVPTITSSNGEALLAGIPSITQPSEHDFYRLVQDFYTRCSTQIVDTVRAACEEHSIECIVLGSLVFNIDKVVQALNLPVVRLGFSPLYVSDAGKMMAPRDHELEAIRHHAKGFIRQAYLLESVGVRSCLAADEDENKDDESTGNMFVQMREQLTLYGFSGLIEGNQVPGIPSYKTGFWFVDESATGEAKADLLGDDAAHAETLKFLRDGTPPVCINFGSMDVYENFEWPAVLVDAVLAANQRLLIIGKNVPAGLSTDRAGVYTTKFAAHSLVFPLCSAVVHHGGAGTTAQVLRSGVPSIVVPFLHWADQDDWGRFVASVGAGVHVDLREAESLAAEDGRLAAMGSLFNDALGKLLGDADRDTFRAAAAKAGAFIDGESGVDRAVTCFEEHFAGTDAAVARGAVIRDLEHLAAPATRLSHSQQFFNSAYLLFRQAESRQSHAVLCENRNAWFKQLQATANAYPVYKADWPKLNQPLDLAVHDLPHSTSKIEWWYFHAHITADNDTKTPYSIFGAVFSTVFCGTTLHHGHASVFNAETKKHTYRSIGDGRAPKLAREAWKRLASDEYFKRSLAEIYEDDVFPAPDERCPDPFVVATDSMNMKLGDISLVKLGDDSYRVALTPAGPDGGCGTVEATDVGFDLVFKSSKAAVRNGNGGISPGGTNDHNLFYYSITRMEVQGTLTQDGNTAQVRGSGWYDHEFGGDNTHKNARSKNPKYKWIWIGVQLDDGREVVYAVTDDPVKKVQIGKMAMIVRADGSTSTHDDESSVVTHRTWSSLKTYVSYGTAWTLVVGEGDDQITLELEAAGENQELVSIISEPAYWEGRVNVKGQDAAGNTLGGIGFVEQYGVGGDMSNFRDYLGAVSKIVFASVERTLPRDPTPTQMNRLILDDEFAPYIKGISRKVFIESMIEPVRTITDRCGKGWRSMGLLLAAYAVGGDPERLTPFISFPEFLHVGSLIIDDIQDDSDIRRKGPTCHKVYGIPTAINAGTAAYFLGEGLTREVDMSDTERIELYRLYFNCLRGAHTGQALDMAGLQHLVPECLESGNFESLDDNITITHRLKSGLPACTAARIGTLLGGGSLEQQQAMGDYFMALGLAFQIMDDVINLRGFQLGLKTHAEDLIEGKITAPVVKAFMKISHDERLWLYEQMKVNGKQKDRDVDAVLAKLEECHAIDDCISDAKRIVEEAWQRVAKVLPHTYARLVLRAFGWFVVSIRDY